MFLGFLFSFFFTFLYVDCSPLGDMRPPQPLPDTLHICIYCMSCYLSICSKQNVPFEKVEGKSLRLLKYTLYPAFFKFPFTCFILFSFHNSESDL